MICKVIYKVCGTMVCSMWYHKIEINRVYPKLCGTMEPWGRGELVRALLVPTVPWYHEVWGKPY